MQRQAPIRVAAFVALTALFTAPFWWLMIAHRRSPATSEVGYGLMWAPAAAAFVVGRGKDVGWAWPAWRYLAFGWLAPVGYGLASYAVVWTAGLVDTGGIADLRAYFGFVDLPAAAMMAFATMWTLTISTLANAAYALGEEIGWRGFLVPALVPRIGVVGAGLVSGAVWAAWHYPLMFAAPSGWTVHELVCFTVLAVSAAVTLSWLRMRSGSVWPAVLFHASHNAFITYLDQLSVGGEAYRSETGYAPAIACALLAAGVVWRTKRGR